MSHQKIAPTFQLRLFNDADLRKERHDTIMLWTEKLIRAHPDYFESYVDAPALTPVEELWLREGEKTSRWEREAHFATDEHTIHRDFFRDVGKHALGVPPTREPVAAGKIIWECPLYASRESHKQIGYVDFRVTLRYARPVGITVVSAVTLASALSTDTTDKQLEVVYEASNRLRRSGGTIGIRNGSLEELGWRTSSLYPAERQNGDKQWIRNNESSLVHAVGDDALLDGRKVYKLVSAKWEFAPVEKFIFLEIKSEVQSLGELIRQLRFYQGHGCRPLVVVAPPNEQLSQTLSEQGFGFFPYSHNRS